jgi:hypothetical protein
MMDFMERIKSRAEARRRGAYLGGRMGKSLCFAQGDQSIANQAGASFRSDLNSELQALVTLNSGVGAPSTTYAHELWADTTSNVLKKRNAANSAWLVVRTLDESFVVSRSSNTILGLSDIGKTILASSSFTQTLTAAATLADGWWIDYANVGTGTIVFDPNSTETINGQTTLAFGPGESGTIYCNGSSFQIVKRSRYAGAIGAGRKIAARTNAATPNTKVDITADELQLRDASGNFKTVSAVSVTIDFGTTGANALDTGAQASSTWYYGWVIAKEDGTVAGLGSTSATAPTMPSGYTYKALATAARSDGSTHFVAYRQFGNKVWYELAQAIGTSLSATAETTLTTSSVVPSIALEFTVDLQNLQITASGTNLDATLNLRHVSSANFVSKRMFDNSSGSGGLRQYPGPQVTVPNSGNFYYIWTVASGTGQQVDIYGNGFKLPLGGE